MAKIDRPLFGDQASGSIAGLLTFRTRGGKTETMQQVESTKPPSATQQQSQARFALAHAEWMQLPKQQFHINKRYYWKRVPDWPTYYRAWPAPTAPTNLTATAISGTQINLAWTDNSHNEAGFKIERKTGAGGTWSEITTTSANATTWQDSGLTAGVTYYYRVHAYNVVGDSGLSNEASATTISLQPPAAPTNLTLTLLSKTSIRLNWQDNSSNEDNFRIERKTGAGGTWSEITTTSANATTYTDTGLTVGGPYYYRVRASNSAGNSAYSNEPYTETQLIITPTNLTATVVSATEIDLAWTDNSTFEYGTKIERKTGTGGTWGSWSYVGENITTYANTNLAGNTTYVYRIKAWGELYDSSSSNEASATTPNPTCFFAIAEGQSLDGTWAPPCTSTHRAGSFAKFYTFTLTSTKTATITLIGAQDAYLYLMSGIGSSGTILAQDDNSGGGTDARIIISLTAGSYTIEATTTLRTKLGAFTITLQTT